MKPESIVRFLLRINKDDRETLVHKTCVLAATYHSSGVGTRESIKRALELIEREHKRRCQAVWGAIMSTELTDVDSIEGHMP
jgi:effector-binding domain-containing protein